jgi:hypothetical protein
LESVHHGHVAIHQHQVEGLARRWQPRAFAVPADNQADCFPTIEGDGDPMAEQLEHLLCHVDVVVVVLDDEHVRSPGLCDARQSGAFRQNWIIQEQHVTRG